MKKWTVVILLLIFTLTCGISVGAASIPKQTGMITDPIELLSDKEKLRVEQALNTNELYQLYVLTATQLTEDQGLQLAEEAYDQWSLGMDDVLLVITTNDNYVHLFFDNIHLKDAIAASVARDVTGLIERTFVPQAKLGHIAEGIIEVSSWLNQLKPVGPDSTPGQLPSESGSEGVASPSPSPDSSNSVQKEPQKTKEGISLVRIVLPFLFILLLFYLISKSLGGIRVRKATEQKLQQLKQTSRLVISSLSTSLLSEIFRELELGFYQGKTKKQLEGLEKRALELQKKCEALHANLDSFIIPRFFATDQQLSELDRMGLAVGELDQQVNELNGQLDTINEQGKKVAKNVELSKEREQKCLADIKILEQQTSYPLTHLHQCWEEASRDISNADDMDEFDPLGAELVLADAEVKLSSLDEAIEELKKLIAEYDQQTLTVKEVEQEIKEKVSREGLLLRDDNPLDILGKTKQQLESAKKNMYDGHIGQLRSSLNTVKETISEAKKKMSDLLHYRDESRRMVETVEKLVMESSHYNKLYLIEMDKVKRKYAQHHWEESIYKEIQFDIEDLRQKAAGIKVQLDPYTQKYREAYELTKEASITLHELKNKQQKCLSSFDHLESALFNSRMQLDMYKNRIQTALDELVHQKVPKERYQQAAHDAATVLVASQKSMEVLPVDLDRVAEQQRLLHQSVEALILRASQILLEKQKVMQQFQQFQSQFINSQRQYGQKINISRQFKGYAQSIHDIEAKILGGNYAGAAQAITVSYVLIEQMKSAYQKRIAQENRRRNSMNSSWGGGSSSGRSSGSSSWGGGSSSGRSSGSSGWGGGSSSGRSSGSSSWGGGSSGRSSGSSGRGSGSSKW